jgi:DNA-binding NarL/FixJ family response regulator
MSIRVGVVEDDSLTRLAICAALSSRGLVVVLEAATATEALEGGERSGIEVAVLDLHLGQGPTGLDVARALRSKNPSVGIVFLTSFDDPRMLDASLPILPGGAQYLVKSSINSIDSLIAAVELAHTGKGKTASPGAKAELGKLTDTQVETLRFLAEGLSNAEIAKKRFVTERSVEVSISRIAKALGLAPDATRNQRVHMAKVYFRSSGGNTL